MYGSIFFETFIIIIKEKVAKNSKGLYGIPTSCQRNKKTWNRSGGMAGPLRRRIREVEKSKNWESLSSRVYW